MALDSPTTTTTAPAVSAEGPLQVSIPDVDFNTPVMRGTIAENNVAFPPEWDTGRLPVQLATPETITDPRVLNPVQPGIGTSITRGLLQTEGSLAGAAGLVGDLTGIDPLKQWGYQKYTELNEEAAKFYPKEVASLYDVDSFGKFGTWVYETLFEQLPNTAASLVGGGVGALGARTLGKSIIERSAAKAIGTRAAELVASGSTTAAAQATAFKELAGSFGAQAGLFATTSTLESGSNYGESVDQRGFENTRPWVDLGFGIMNGAIDLIGGEGQFLRKLVGRPTTAIAEQQSKNFLERNWGTISKALAGGDSTEALQEISSAYNQAVQNGQYDISAEDLRQAIEAGIAGSIAGVGFAGPNILTDALRKRTVDNPNEVTSTPSVNTVDSYKAKLEERDPSTGITGAQTAAYLSDVSRKNQAIQEIDREYDTHATQLKDQFQNIGARMAQLQRPTDPAITALPPEARQKELTRLSKQHKSLVSQYARVTQDRNEAYKQRAKDLEKAAAKAGTSIQSAAEKTAIFNARRKAGLYDKVENFDDQLFDILSDVDTYSNRKLEILFNTRNQIEAATKQYSAVAEQAAPNAAFNPYTYGMLSNTMSKLVTYKAEVDKSIQNMLVSAEKVASTAAAAFDMRDINAAVKEFYESDTTLTANAAKNMTYFKLMKMSVEERQKLLENMLADLGISKDVANIPSVDSALSKFPVYSTPGEQLYENMYAQEYARNDLESKAAVDNARVQAKAEELAQQEASQPLSEDVRAKADLASYNLRKRTTAENYNRLNTTYNEELDTMPDVQSPNLRSSYPAQDTTVGPPPNLAARQQAWQESTAQERATKQIEERQGALNTRNNNQAQAAVDRLSSIEKELETAYVTAETNRVYQYVSSVLKSLPGLIENTHICVSMNDVQVPVALRQAILNQVYQGKPIPKGAYYNGKIYLFTAQLTNKAQAVRTLLHEGVAHYGLRAIMTPVQFVRYMSSVYKDMADTDLWKNWVAKQGRAYQGADPLVQAEEFCAWIASRQSVRSLAARSSGFKSLLVYIRDLFKKLLGGTKVNEADIIDTLAAAAKDLSTDQSAFNQNSLLYSSDVTPDLSPDFTRLNLSKPTDSTIPYGWGTVFSSVGKMKAWYRKFNSRMSGMPGLESRNLIPTPNQFINLDRKLADQPYVMSKLAAFVESASASITFDKKTKTFTVNVGTVPVFSTTNEAKAQQVQKSPVRVMTGKNMLDYITSLNNADAKGVARDLRQLGIAGTIYTVPQGKKRTDPQYLVFEGDDVKSEPAYASPAVRFDVTADTTIPEMPDNYLDEMGRHLLGQQTWNQKMMAVMKGGTSVGPNGKIIEHSDFERTEPASFGEYNDWITPDTKAYEPFKAPTWFERMVEYWFDSDSRVLAVQRYLKNVVSPNIINSTTNLYRNLTGISNRITTRKTEFWNEAVVPLMAKVKDLDIPEVNQWIQKAKLAGKKLSATDLADLKMRAIDTYLYARHAQERNKAIRARLGVNHTTHTAMSGMSDEAAQKILDRFAGVTGIEEVGNMVDEINRTGLAIIKRDQLLPKSTIDKIEAAYQHYVPLKNWDEFVGDICPEAVTRKTRSGISTGNKNIAKKAKGRAEGDLPASPLANSVLQVLDLIAISEKNRIGRNLLELVRSTSHLKDLWEIDGKPDTPEYKLAEDGKSGRIVYRQKATHLEGQGLKFVSVLDKDGRKVSIAIKDEALARALRNENLATTGPIIDLMRKGTQFLGKLYTSGNPLFIIKNPTRDMTTAVLNMGNVIDSAQQEGLLGADQAIRKGLTKDFFSGRMFKFLYKQYKGQKMLTNEDKQLAALYQEFELHGGHMRMFDVKDFKDSYVNLRALVKTKSTPRKLIESAAEYVDMLADVTENATRFSVYVNLVEAFDKHLLQRAKDEKWTPEETERQLAMGHQRAANEALECTVNFSRKGAGAPLFNTLYMFSSATIAGNVRIMQNLWRKDSTRAENIKRLSTYLGASVGGSIAMATLARTIMGTDDDGENKYDKIPSYVKDSNLIIPSIFGDGGYVKIPLPFGYNLFTTMGNVVDSVIHGKLDATHAMARIVSAGFDGFSPIGTTNGTISDFVPTLFRPVSQIFENKNTFGYNIYPESGPSDSGKPDSQKYWSTNPAFYRAIAETLNSWTFGSQVESGFIDVSPESLQHLFESYTGGVGRIITQSLDMALSPVTGAPIELKDIPVVSTFLGKTGYSDTLNTYSALRNSLQVRLNEIKLATEDPKVSPTDRAEVIRRNASAKSLQAQYDNATRRLMALSKQQADYRKAHGSTGPGYYKQKEQIDKARELAMRSLIRAANQRGFKYNVE